MGENGAKIATLKYFFLSILDSFIHLIFRCQITHSNKKSKLSTEIKLDLGKSQRTAFHL